MTIAFLRFIITLAKCLKNRGKENPHFEKTFYFTGFRHPLIWKNYDYQNRPRRQDFSGELMENGAFYINTVKNILAHRNCLGGKIGIYEMPGYTATEIDEPDDWMIIENLMKKHILSK